jgi:7,8-dihydro-6-hydroxymethylpterin-pyrophosphokinase
MKQNNPHILYLLLGSNLGDKKKQMKNAVRLINEIIGQVTRYSSIYETGGFLQKNPS